MPNIKEILAKRKTNPNSSIQELILETAKELVLSLWSKFEKQAVDEVKTVVKGEIIDLRTNVKKGDKGERGNDGYTPIKGKDYFDGKDGKDAYIDKQKLISDILSKIPKPKDGIDGITKIIENATNIDEVIKKINALEGSLDIKTIKGLEIYLKNLQRAIKEKTRSMHGGISNAQRDKLDGIEEGADVTDATNVATAGALMVADIDDTPVDGVTNAPISSNWAYDHENDTTTHGATGAVVGTTNTQTLTNKRITKRVATTTDDATAVININLYDVYELSAIANATEFTLTGTPTDGQSLIIRLKDAGVSKALTWTGFTVIGSTTLPVATTAGKWHYVGCQYNSAASAWHVLAAEVEP